MKVTAVLMAFLGWIILMAKIILLEDGIRVLTQ